MVRCQLNRSSHSAAALTEISSALQFSRQVAEIKFCRYYTKYVTDRAVFVAFTTKRVNNHCDK
jgi:hypothetical protein